MQRPSLISPSPGVIPGNDDPSPGPVPPSPAGPPCLRGFFTPARRGFPTVPATVETSEEDAMAALSDLFELSIPWWEIVLRGTVVYFVLLLLLRLSGKRTVGQFTDRKSVV